ncbi:hypothetical protein MTO96_003405 [Rhipicephalus appendiculatus]
MPCPRKVTDHAEAPVAENSKELCKPTFSNERVTDGSFYQRVTWQQLLESEMGFDQRITVWSSFDLLRRLPCQQTVKIPFLTKALPSFPDGCKLNLDEYITRNLGPMLPSTTALAHIASSGPLLSHVSLVLTGQEKVLPLGLLTVYVAYSVYSSPVCCCRQRALPVSNKPGAGNIC